MIYSPSKSTSVTLPKALINTVPSPTKLSQEVDSLEKRDLNLSNPEKISILELDAK